MYICPPFCGKVPPFSVALDRLKNSGLHTCTCACMFGEVCYFKGFFYFEVLMCLDKGVHTYIQ